VDLRPCSRRASVAGVLAIASLVLTGGCIAPARTFDAYAGKAAATAESSVSALRTAVLGARVAAESRSFPPTISILVSEAEREVTWARDAFISIQPPDRASDRLRGELVPMLDTAVNGLSELRITARRADLKALPARAAPLRDLADRLEAFAMEYGT
jgi:hypothetical protein